MGENQTTPLLDQIDMTTTEQPAIDAAGYVPTDDEPFMSERQLAWFRNLLLQWREDIQRTSGDTLDHLRESPIREPDLAERAAAETEWRTELRARDRDRKLLAKIADALSRIEDGEYGWCEMTGEPIAIGRLIARPIATMTIAAQQLYERREKMSRAA